VQQVAHLHRERELLSSGKKNEEDVFLITDLKFNCLKAEEFARLKRLYWHIENKLHYRKDFVFDEDRSTIRTKFGPQNMSSLRNFAIGLLTCLGINNVKRCVENLQHNPMALVQESLPPIYKMAA
jgi:predicted transposase YbfD/YdcC